MTLNVKLNMDESGLGGGSGMRGMGRMMGRIGSSFDYRTKYQMGESGKVEVDKASVARQKSMLGSVEGLAKAIPGGGMMTNMAKSFMKGGPIGLIATGITAAASTLVAILKGSQTYQTLSKTWMTILSAMADMFLMPFVPLAMKGFQVLLDWMPKVADWGQKTYNAINWLIEAIKELNPKNWFGSSGKAREAMAQGDAVTAFKETEAPKLLKAYANTITPGGGRLLDVGMKGIAGITASGVNIEKGITELATGPASDTNKKVKDMATKQKQTEKAFWSKWYDAMFGNSIVPDTFATIKGMYGNVANEAATTGKEVAGESGKNQKKGMFRSLVDCLKGLGGSIGTFISGLSVPQIPLPKFKPPSIDAIKDCLKAGGAAIGGFFTNTLPNLGK